MPQRPNSTRTNWLATMLATLVGFGLLFAPNSQTDRLEAIIHDAALPGLRVFAQVKSQTGRLPLRMEQLVQTATPDSVDVGEGNLNELQSQIVHFEEKIRGLQSQNATLLEELRQTRAQSGSPFVAEPGTPLFVPDLLDANIVAADDVSVAVQRASAQHIVDVGQTDGVVPADFVVSPGQQTGASHKLLIDQGENDGLRADQPVFAGRCVLGKIQQVGRWTSSLLPITDHEFRGRAQLMRQTDRGLVVGPEGILAGDGNLACQLEFIPATQPVAVGDEVYTALEGSPLPVPMYYGRVTVASLPDGAPYWDVHVKPAETVCKLRSVQVLRIVLNPARTHPVSVTGEVP